MDKIYMRRCLELASKGKPKAFPNPLVGCVIVKNNQIISEGYHEKIGSHHAEIEAIKKIKNKKTLEGADIYINLEPCSHYGKTPPCVDEILKYKFKNIIIGTKDTSAKVNGKGIEKLKDYNVKLNCLKKECRILNKRFFINQEKQRPYIILKWAQTKNNFIGYKNENKKRLIISNSKSLKVTHKWRSVEAAILIGKNTAIKDNPKLTTRLHKGKNPIRIILDQNLTLNTKLNIFNKESKTIIINNIKNVTKENIRYVKILNNKNFLKNLCLFLHKNNIYSLTVEGGSVILNLFLKNNLWDEARVFISQKTITGGIKSPAIKKKAHSSHNIQKDKLNIYHNFNL